MKNIYERLLKRSCDALIELQDTGKDKAFRGGFYCRSCKMIHGRGPDAVYGLVVMSKISKSKKYMKAAEEVFDYGYNMECPDGALYNDAQAEWRCTTTFHEVAVMEALIAGKDILSEEFKAKMEKRALSMAEWLYINLDEHNPAHINYPSNNCYALAIVGKYFGIQKYIDQAKHLAEYAMQHFTDNNVLYGESTPHNALSAKNCNSIDIGYNVEESIPSLVKYAYLVGDEKLKDRLYDILVSNMDFMFPDGGWDNSFGNRNYKWTYWGSRTSDGCAPGYLLMADRDPRFAELVYRNALLLEKCTDDHGLLYGGPHYGKHGEYACTHHTFEHMNVYAFAIDSIEKKYLAPKPAKLPCDSGDFVKYYPECRTYRMAKGNYHATFTDYDFNLVHSGHATGGAVTALYNKEKGPMIMASTTIYVLVEPTNMQQALDRDHHRSLTPRIEIERDNVIYYSTYNCYGDFAHHTEGGKEIISVDAGLADRWLKKLDGVEPKIEYVLDDGGLRISVSNLHEGKYVLPLINGNCEILAGKLENVDDIFYLIGGFMAKEYDILPDENGNIEIKIS